MKLFIPPIEVGERDGFTPAKDLFGRKKTGEGLTNLISNVTDPIVIAVDGQWGSGKSTFLKMWAGELRKNDIPVIYFDAFENDYLDDAFMALASEIIKLAKEKNVATESQRAFYEKTSNVASAILSSALKLAVKVGTAGILDGIELGNAKEAVTEAAKSAEERLNQLIDERLAQMDAEKAIIPAFKEALSSLPRLLSNSDSDKPLVIIIDELDRCRPVFALQILERMKHFFSVPNVHFVLGVHMGQLCKSVEYAYGQGIDSHTYLQKFIHYSFSLDANDSEGKSSSRTNLADYTRNLVQFHDPKPTSNNSTTNAVAFIIDVANANKFSLRNIEHIISNLFLIKSFINSEQNDIFFGQVNVIIGGLCILKIINPDLYKNAKSGSLEYQNLRHIFSKKQNL
jgi:KAP family P-loop domain